MVAAWTVPVMALSWQSMENDLAQGIPSRRWLADDVAAPVCVTSSLDPLLNDTRTH